MGSCCCPTSKKKNENNENLKKNKVSKESKKEESKKEFIIKIATIKVPDKQKGFYNIDEAIEEVMGYKLSQEIGRGGQSVVRLATKLETNEVFASKRMDLSSGVAIDKKKLFSFKTELYIMSKCKHQNIVTLIDQFWVKNNHFYSYLIMEFASGGSLKSELLNRTEPYSEEETKHYFVQIVGGLKYLLEEHYVSHLDIKLQNILIFQSLETQEKVIKLSDFGLSRISYSQQFGLSMRKIDYGTIAYMSPQVLAFYLKKILKRKDKLIIESTKQKVIPCQADIWSLGICLYLMLCKAFPFDPDIKGIKNKDDKCYHMLEQQSKEKYSFPKLIKRQLSKQVKHLIASMLIFDPNQRITIKCITAHEWVFDYFPHSSIGN